MNQTFDWRRFDRKIFLIAAIVFPLLVLTGFGPTYYLRFAFDPPPLGSLILHLHGIVMTAWVIFFVFQVFLIRSRRHRVHMSLGMAGIGLAILVLVTGFLTAAAAAKYGFRAAPPDIPQLTFFIVPLTDMIMFAGLFGAAIYYRKRPADHKRLMLLTVLNFLPPAIARIPIAAVQSFGPLYFFGVPAVLAIGFLIYDTRSNGTHNKPLLIGTLALIASYPLRLMVGVSGAWISFAEWITSWAA
ncbi:MAG: hypothetical protein AB7F88_18925 [Pyrinomonadaceae bacterium]